MFIKRIHFIIILFTIGLVQTSSSAAYAQVTLKENHAPLEKVLHSIEKQSGYVFLYTGKDVQSLSVSVEVNNVPVTVALDKCLKDLPLSYKVLDKNILLKRKESATEPGKTIDPIKVSGQVVDTTGATVPGATVRIKGIGVNVITNNRGEFTLSVPDKTTLVVSSIGYQSKEVDVADDKQLRIVLRHSTSKLDEVQVIAYGTTTRRLSTGSVSTVGYKEIENQPVMNPLAALEGRVPGMIVTQNTGLPGGNFSINIRGRTSINNNISNDPLFIIDGVPFANNNSGIGNLASAYAATGGLSPFNTINPADIESIDILKDADATSIYGSRGANGVVLVTTKKGKEGKTTVNANVYTGVNSVTKTMDMMNTTQYLAMRNEALANDGVVADQYNAYDLVLWDTTRNTDWQKYLMGNKAHTLDANLSISGGSNNTQFLVGGGYHRETTVMPGNLSDGRASMHFSINHKSADNKFKMLFTGSYGADRNHLIGGDLTNYIYLAPNTISPMDSTGKLNWEDNGVVIDNPMFYLYQKYLAKTDNYLSNLSLSYEVARGLFLKSTFGYNAIYMNELSTYPIAAQNPAYSPVGYSSFSNISYKSLIVEPQIEYAKKIGIGKLDALVGGTWQQNTSNGSYVNASGYTSDLLIESLSAASTIDYKSSTSTDYRYAAFFGRINYNINNKYLINATGRRDGSSRFGPENRFANFGAIGASWIFSEEKWVKNNVQWLSFGKLRASYGTTGNDKIGDYNYLDTWTALSKTYLGQAGLNPTRLFNPNYRWEINKKLEAGLDLGFLKDRLLLTANWYHNRSSNQLIPYTLPAQTGGGSVIANFPAVVQNTGVEFLVNSVNIKNRSFEWNSSFNISIPKNKLISFPNLETSSYYATLVVGKPLNALSSLLVKDVNPQTGVYEFIAKDGSTTSTPTSADIRTAWLDLNPKYFGGLGNNLKYKGFQLDVFFEFKKQMGQNYLGNIITSYYTPGTPFNMPVAVMDRWTPDNTNTSIQKFTTTTGSAASLAANSLRSYGGDIMYSDASYIRLKNLSFSYAFPSAWVSKMSLKTLRIYLNAQNLATITGYEGGDPETRNIYRMPPLRTISFGIQAIL